MFKHLTRITLPPALLLSAGLAVSMAWSKPPDLPIDVKETCKPQCPNAVPQEGATIFTCTGIEERGTTAAAPHGVAKSGATCQQKIMDAEAYKAHAAQSLYEIAQQCEDKGDLAMARNCYEEATRMGPDSEYGKLASRKLTAITVASVENRAVRGGVETEEEPPLINATQQERLDPHRVQQSHTMLLMGIRFLRTGDLDNAYRCFQDAHVVCPACSDGQSALDRMRQIERTKSGGLQNREGGIEEQEPPSDRRPPLTPDELDKRDQAEALFKLGERSRRAGNLETAYGLYQETHLVFPECFYGMRAIERMSEIETHR
jgi:tetratricopeptide (TPR) repeat protein